MTLSPVPGFMPWLKQRKPDVPVSEDERRLLLAHLDNRRLGPANAEFDGATACRARTARGALFPEGPHSEGTADRFGGAIPSRQRRAAGADRLASAICRRRACANRPASWSTISIVSTTSKRTTKPTPMTDEVVASERGEAITEERRPPVAGYAAVVSCAIISIHRHAWACPGHPRLYDIASETDVDGRDKLGHDELLLRRQRLHLLVQISFALEADARQIPAW